MKNQLPHLETLRRIAVGMGPQQGFQASLKGFLALLAERHGFLRPHLVIFDPETRTLRLCVADSAPRNGQVVYEPGMGVTGQVFVSGKPVIVERMEGHSVFLSKFFARTPKELASLAFLCVPVLAPQTGTDTGETGAREVIGVLSVDTPVAPLEMLEQQRVFLEVVAGMIAAQAAYLRDDMERQRRLTNRRHTDSPEIDPSGCGLIAESRPMREALEQASYAGQGRLPVLITGEPGTGKARLAAFIHAASARHELPLICFDAAQFGFSPERSAQNDRTGDTGGTVQPEDEAERMLFGYRKGAFPGAAQTHKGLFELAHCSTLFLAHVDRLSLTLQTKLLRVLQEQAVVRVGGGLPVSVDVRLICSCTQELGLRVASGFFLKELQERVSVFPIQLLPLRERPEDILPLAERFLINVAETAGRPAERFAAPAREALLRHDWPGNIHELTQCMERAVHVCEESTVHTVHLPVLFRDAEKKQHPSSLPFNDAVARFEQELLIDALQRTRGNMLQAARDLRVSYRILNYKVKKYEINLHECSIT